MEFILELLSQRDSALIFFQGCQVLNFWALHFNLGRLCVFRIIGLCFYCASLHSAQRKYSTFNWDI